MSAPKVSVTIITGSSAAARTLDRAMYLSLSKRYYANRHLNYHFEHLLSSQFEMYFPEDLFGELKGPLSQTAYFRGISKLFVVIDL